MGKFGFNVLALLLVLITGPIDTVSSLSCYTCTNLAVSNSILDSLLDTLEKFGLSGNKACEIFDPSGVSLEECQESSNRNEVVACETWEGSFTLTIPHLGSTEISGQKRGCALVSTGEMHKCKPLSDVPALLSTVINLYLAGKFTIGDVQGMHCMCDRNYCTGADDRVEDLQTTVVYSCCSTLSGSLTITFSVLALVLMRSVNLI